MLENIYLKKRVKINISFWTVIFLIIVIIGFVFLMKINQTKETQVGVLDNSEERSEKQLQDIPASYKAQYTLKKVFDPEQFRKETNLTEAETRDKGKVAFDVKFPPDDAKEKIGSLVGIKGSKTFVQMLFSNGILVEQFYPTDPLETRNLKNLVPDTLNNKDDQEDIQKGTLKIVNVNGVGALAHPSYVEDEVFGEAYRVPANVSWYKNGVMYRITQVLDSDIPLDGLLEIAKFFD